MAHELPPVSVVSASGSENVGARTYCRPKDSYTAVGYALIERKRGGDEDFQDRYDKQANT